MSAFGDWDPTTRSTTSRPTPSRWRTAEERAARRLWRSCSATRCALGRAGRRRAGSACSGSAPFIVDWHRAARPRHRPMPLARALHEHAATGHPTLPAVGRSARRRPGGGRRPHGARHRGLAASARGPRRDRALLHRPARRAARGGVRGRRVTPRPTAGSAEHAARAGSRRRRSACSGITPPRSTSPANDLHVHDRRQQRRAGRATCCSTEPARTGRSPPAPRTPRARAAR